MPAWSCSSRHLLSQFHAFLSHKRTTFPCSSDMLNVQRTLKLQLTRKLLIHLEPDDIPRPIPIKLRPTLLLHNHQHYPHQISQFRGFPLQSLSSLSIIPIGSQPCDHASDNHACYRLAHPRHLTRLHRAEPAKSRIRAATRAGTLSR